LPYIAILLYTATTYCEIKIFK